MLPNERTHLEPIDLGVIHESASALKRAAASIIIGQDRAIELLLVALLADGHVLIEGVPGVAKTLLAKTMARLLGLGFGRIQFTPDLMPTDVTGTNIFDPRSAAFTFRPGPIFNPIVLIDEINRAPAKTQSALFEVMEEKQVTVDGTSYVLDDPFLVVATQNPIEHEGTYRLPEAQLDRFLFKLDVTYPDLEQETNILREHDQQRGKYLLASLAPVWDRDTWASCKKEVRKVHVEDALLDYIARIVTATRKDRSIYLGASPRASIAILNAAKALAALEGRSFVIPEDIAYLAPSVLRHRIILSPEKEMEGSTPDAVLQELIGKQEIPR